MFTSEKCTTNKQDTGAYYKFLHKINDSPSLDIQYHATRQGDTQGLNDGVNRRTFTDL